MAENLCVKNNCHACCINSRLELSLEEASTLRGYGTILTGIFHLNGRRNTPRGKEKKAYYDLDNSCGILTHGLCSLYNSQLRPKVCENLIPGSKNCLELRKEKGLGDLLE